MVTFMLASQLAGSPSRTSTLAMCEPLRGVAPPSELTTRKRSGVYWCTKLHWDRSPESQPPSKMTLPLVGGGGGRGGAGAGGGGGQAEVEALTWGVRGERLPA